jgi:hypothetical protein
MVTPACTWHASRLYISRNFPDEIDGHRASGFFLDICGGRGGLRGWGRRSFHTWVVKEKVK